MQNITIIQEATWFGKTTKTSNDYIEVSDFVLGQMRELLRAFVDSNELDWFIINTADGNLIDAYRK